MQVVMSEQVLQTVYDQLPPQERIEVVPFDVCASCGKPIMPWQNGLCDECETRLDDDWARNMLGGDDR